MSLPVLFTAKLFIYGHLLFLSSHSLSDLPPFLAERVDAERGEERSPAVTLVHVSSGNRKDAKEGNLQLHVCKGTKSSHLFSLGCFSQSGTLNTYLSG